LGSLHHPPCCLDQRHLQGASLLARLVTPVTGQGLYAPSQPHMVTRHCMALSTVCEGPPFSCLPRAPVTGQVLDLPLAHAHPGVPVLHGAEGAVQQHPGVPAHRHGQDPHRGGGHVQLLQVRVCRALW